MEGSACLLSTNCCRGRRRISHLIRIVYVLFFARGFANLLLIRRTQPGHETSLFAGALHSFSDWLCSRACSAPEAYQYYSVFRSLLYVGLGFNHPSETVYG